MENETNQAAGQGAARVMDRAEMKAARERTFDEMPLEQKIEVLRRELRITREAVQMQSNLISTLMRHEHKGDGSMLVPIERHTGTQAGEAFGYRYDPLR